MQYLILDRGDRYCLSHIATTKRIDGILEIWSGPDIRNDQINLLHDEKTVIC